ncbi:Uncharacterised protein g105 [Pycnogonum litorale]
MTPLKTLIVLISAVVAASVKVSVTTKSHCEKFDFGGEMLFGKECSICLADEKRCDDSYVEMTKAVYELCVEISDPCERVKCWRKEIHRTLNESSLGEQCFGSGNPCGSPLTE